MQIIHHGGKDTVTGSCHEVRLGRGGILIDCGLFQGDESQHLKVDFPVRHIRALVITHSHIDHIGRIPWLLAVGFKGPIYCTQELIPLMLEDGLKINLNLDKGQWARVLQQVQKQLKPLPYNQWHRLELKPKHDKRHAKSKMGSKQKLVRAPARALLTEPTDHRAVLYLRFQSAGHILGSAYIELKTLSNQIIVFSGDLGPANTPLLSDPVPLAHADILFLESTYGDKAHESIATRRERLNQIIQRSVQDDGAVIIPAFGVGRTQELLFDIEQLLHEKKLMKHMPVIGDSPLAAKVTRSYRRYKKLWNREAKMKLAELRMPLAFGQCITIDSHQQHLA